MTFSRAWAQRILDVLLSTDKPQRIRSAQAALAGVLMLACVAELNFLALAGIVDSRFIDLWSGFCIVGALGFYALIRSGYSRRYKDPSLAVAQMIYAIACNAVAFVIAGQGRGVTLPIVAVVLMFGMFGLSMRQILSVAIYALVLFGAAILFLLESPSTMEPAALLGTYFSMIGIVLSGTTFLTWRLQQMRKHMHDQKQQLTLALEKIQLAATRDELTSTFNRKHMHELMQVEVKRSERSQSHLLIAMLDIDYFKHINDAHGHRAGDHALQAFAKALQGEIRSSDTLARWGGEEFIIMLTDVTLDQGAVSLERVREKVEAVAISYQGATINLTVSIGVAQHLAGDSIEQTIERADRALYAAKSRGRNLIVTDGSMP